MIWWLMLLSFVLGFVLTWLWSVRTVTRRVPRAAGRVVYQPDQVRSAAAIGATAARASSVGTEGETTAVDGPLVEDFAAESVAPEPPVDGDVMHPVELEAESEDLPAVPLPPTEPEGMTEGDPTAYDAEDASYVESRADTYDEPDIEAIAEAAALDSDAALAEAGASAGISATGEVVDEGVVTEPYGPGSAAAAADGSGPEGWTIKGNAESMLFHTEQSPGYARTRAQVWFQDEASAAAAGFHHWDRRRRGGLTSAVSLPAARSELTSVPDDEPQVAAHGVPVAADEPYGPGSATPAPDGSGPAGWLIKGNANSMLFHTPESPSYGKTRAEVWFQDEESARAAGFAHWDRNRR